MERQRGTETQMAMEMNTEMDRYGYGGQATMTHEICARNLL